MTDTLARFWAPIRSTLEQKLDSHVQRRDRVVLLDYPLFANVGDLMIYLATVDWMTNRELEVEGLWNEFNFPFRRLPTDTKILCQGGGNFGDVYRHQRFRERVAATYPENRVIFLPQTIFYRSGLRLRESAKVLNRHPNLHLLLRDQPSLQIAEAHFGNCTSELAPDMATLLYPLKAMIPAIPPSPTQDTLYLLRQDSETAPTQRLTDRDAHEHEDWKQMLGARAMRIKLCQTASIMLGRYTSSNMLAQRWQTLSRDAVFHCARRFLAAREVVTSRLHGHMLATLLGVPNTLLDNSYGKNVAYFTAWHRDCPIARVDAYHA